ncbi:hypothetical protein HZA97_03230 [Candidatus Woesearchaeota archaeon]|nr:hypothetical protein [Candidatus Woesearchaeota archaeon]
MNSEQKNMETIIENEVKFSWGAVFKGWVQNLKDDIDPAITGVKMGFFGLHAIPTWMRQSDEGRMHSDKRGLSTLLGLVVFGSEATGYYLAGKYINQTTNSEMGYAVAGVPLGCQAMSWAYEAFLRAKKSELSKVVMSRLQQSFNKEATVQYDLTSQGLVTELAKRLYVSFEEHIKQENEGQQKKIATIEKNTPDRNGERMHEEEVKSRVEQCRNQIEGNNKKLKKYETKSAVYARKEILQAANGVFNGLVADRHLGKNYNMTVDLLTGPVKRRLDREKIDLGQLFDDLEDDDDEREFYSSYQHAGSMLRQIILDTVKSKQGSSATLETFGTITPVYTNAGKDLVYQVKPNNIWKV